MFRGWLMGAMLSVETGVRKAKALDGATVEEMFGDDLLDVFEVDEAVPDGFRIDNDDGAVFALVKAAGFIGPDVVFETGLLDGVFEG